MKKLVLFLVSLSSFAQVQNNCTTTNALTKRDASGNLVCSNILEDLNGINFTTHTKFSSSVEFSSTIFTNPTAPTQFNGNVSVFTLGESLKDNMLSFYNERKTDGGLVWGIGNTVDDVAKGTKSGFSMVSGFGNAPATMFFIQDLTGKVGIGTNNIPTTAGSVNVSNYKLFVKGGMLTEEVRIILNNTWADYVFAKNYKLPTLLEVEKQIQTKGHLANMPSAKEVAANGIELGEMAKLQQEKIEELTLYIIEQNKANEKQYKILDKQSQEIEALKVLVQTLVAKK